MIQPVSIPIHIRVLAERAAERNHEPVTVGIPFPRSLAPSLDGWRLLSVDGPLRLQTRVHERWPDGSVRWALLDFAVRLPRGADDQVLTLQPGPSDAPADGPVVNVAMTGRRMRIDTGSCQTVLDPDVAGLFAEATANDEAVLASNACSLRLLGAAGESWPVRWELPEIESAGALRSTIVARGRAIAGERTQVALTLRLDVYAGSPTVRLRLTARNPSAATHPRGIWELGDPGSRLIKELSFVLRQAGTGVPASIRYSVERDGAFQRCQSHFHAYQDSSGGPNWQSTNHVNRKGVVPLRFRGYEAHVDGTSTQGLRATPIVTIEDSARSLSVAVPQFWQNFPQAIDAGAAGLAVSFWLRRQRICTSCKAANRRRSSA